MTTRPIRLLAAAALAAVAVVVVPATSAGAAATHVGIVVRFADGSSRTACTSRGTGLAVLERTFSATVPTSGPYAGFVVQISGSGKNPPDTTHYWSYWHSPGNGTWTYSNAGAGSYTPKAGTVEGWSYVDGNTSAPPPPSVRYASLCGSSDPKPAVSSARQSAHKPARTSTPEPARTSTLAPAPPPRHQATTSAEPAPTGAVTSSSAKKTAVGSRTTPVARATTRRAVRRTVPRVPTTSSTAAGESAPAGPIRAADPPAGKSVAGFPAWGSALALLVVLVLGGTAWWRTGHRPE